MNLFGEAASSCRLDGETIVCGRIEFTVPGLPVAQPRQRTRIVAAKGRMFTQNYTPTRDPVNAFKAAVRDAASKAHTGAPLQGPVWLICQFIFPRPKSMIWRTRPMPRVPKAGKPDCDNLLKSVADALTGLLWGDDAQIAAVTVAKSVASGDEQPRTEVIVNRF